MTDSEVRVAERPAQPYVAMSAEVTMETIGAVLPQLMPRMFAWLGQRGIAPAGPPFWKYNVIDMEHLMEVEVGLPVAEPVTADDSVIAGVLPAGRYATMFHTGDPSGLLAATAALLDWASREGVAWDVTPTPSGERWGARLEIYLTDPAAEPDPAKWTTELAFRLAS
jgi:effector-binding domain-containing protein